MSKQIPIHDDGFAIVDDDVYEELSRHKWHLSHGYPARNHREGKRTIVTRIHWAIIGKPPKGFVTDHRNEDKRDNRRENLRFVTKSVNARNQKKHVSAGIHFRKDAQKWELSLSHQGKKLYFGLVDTKEEARSIAVLLRGALIYHELTKGDNHGFG